MAKSLIQMRAEFPDPMRQGMIDLLWGNSVILPELNFIENAGFAYSYSARAKLPGVGFRNLNEDFTPTAGVTNPLVEQLAILGGEIKSDSVAIAVKGVGVRANEITAQIIATAKAFDKNFIIGDPTAGGSGGKGFYGLKKRLSGSQLLTNATDGATVDGNKVRALLASVGGPNSSKCLLMNQTNRLNLETWASDSTALNRSQYIQRLIGPDGKQRVYFDGARIIEVFYDEAESAILPFTETCGTSNVCSSIYCVKFGGPVDEQDVQGLSGLPGNIQSYGPIWTGALAIDVQQMLAGIGIFGGYSAGRLQGCKAA